MRRALKNPPSLQANKVGKHQEQSLSIKSLIARKAAAGSCLHMLVQLSVIMQHAIVVSKRNTRTNTNSSFLTQSHVFRHVEKQDKTDSGEVKELSMDRMLRPYSDRPQSKGFKTPMALNLGVGLIRTQLAYYQEHACIPGGWADGRVDTHAHACTCTLSC